MSNPEIPPYREIKTKTVYGDASISLLQVLERTGDSRAVSYKIFTPPGVSVELIQGGAANSPDSDTVKETVMYLMGQLKPVVGPCNTPMWESPDGRGGQFADPKVALRCWLDRAEGA